MRRVFAPLKHLDERLRHALLAIGLAALGLLMSLFDPIDQLVWIIHSRFVSEQASGQIVLASSDVDFTDPNRPELRVSLARDLEGLREAGAKRIFIDAIFDPSADPAADAQLNATLRGLGDRVFLARRSYTDYDNARTTLASSPIVASGVPEVITEFEARYLGIDWDMPTVLATKNGIYPSLPAAIANIHTTRPSTFAVDYTFKISSIPVVSIVDHSRTSWAPVRGNDVVISLARRSGALLAVTPRTADVPHAIVQIIAAETLLAGYGRELPSTLAWLAAASLLLAILAIASRWGSRVRRAGYILLVGLAFTALVASYMLHVRISPSSAFVIIAAYALSRLRLHWQRRFALTDQASGLPTFRAFERYLQDNRVSNPIVAAKVHGAAQMLKALPSESFSEYTQKLVERLRVSDKGPLIYSADGRYLAWEAQGSDIEQIRGHLEGLRAVCASPLLVGGNELDVAITFGVSHAPDRTAAARIAAAIATVERTSEAASPIEFEHSTSEDDDLWDLSLQSRIDAALANDEITMVYQPKMTIDRASIIGMEGLVRWYDPARGEIPPSQFIEQCETAGRMAHLTRFTLDRAMRDTALLAAHGLDIPVSVNISATLLRDERVVIMVEDALRRMRFPAEKLVLEVTETASIADLERAKSVLLSLKQLGVKLSLDDFGVGAANIEVLARLPFDEVKIDRMFIRNIGSKKGRAIVESLVTMGLASDIAVVAEGVETSEDLAALAELNCSIVQGYGVHLPCRIERLMAAHGLAMKSIPNMV